MNATHTAGTLALALLLGGCAGLPAAQMALPAPLATTAPETVQGLGGGRSGNFQLGGEAGRFERSASRLALFDAALVNDRASASYSSGGVTASCRARQTEAGAGIVSIAPRPYGLACSFGGSLQGTLTLAASGGAAGTRAERSGSASLGGVPLEVRSVHRVQGSPLPLEAPIGYVFLQGGQPVGAVELNGAPRLWRPAAGSALHAAVTHAALALMLVWDPAGS